jgi:hypothetical protein
MKILISQTIAAVFAITLSGLGQCVKPEWNPVWDAGKQQFKCEAPSGSKVEPGDEIVSPKGSKEFCGAARDNLIKVCPAGNESKTCRGQAKTIFNACYKDFKNQGESRTSGSTSQGTTTDRAACMQTFAQQQQACQSRKLPPPAPGQPYVPDTCLQDAMAAQNKCLANSR